MRAQRGCFTVHEKQKIELADLVPRAILKKVRRGAGAPGALGERAIRTSPTLLRVPRHPDRRPAVMELHAAAQMEAVGGQTPGRLNSCANYSRSEPVRRLRRPIGPG